MTITATPPATTAHPAHETELVVSALVAPLAVDADLVQPQMSFHFASGVLTVPRVRPSAASLSSRQSSTSWASSSPVSPQLHESKCLPPTPRPPSELIPDARKLRAHGALKVGGISASFCSLVHDPLHRLLSLLPASLSHIRLHPLTAGLRHSINRILLLPPLRLPLSAKKGARRRKRGGVMAASKPSHLC
ncbi:hypothetical protein K438DRAFT_1962192 [Mycena galopus ATCC 62051]|nr:hypothetical protein K438DRAFT_1962192 [Mycena galopus ATCC 62051]